MNAATRSLGFSTPTEIADGLGDDLASKRAVLAWFKQFLAKPHSKLGRRGAVCPAISGALNKDNLLLKSVRVDKPTEDGMAQILGQLRDIFPLLEPKAMGAGCPLKRIVRRIGRFFGYGGNSLPSQSSIARAPFSVVLILPGIDQDGARLVTDVRWSMKTSFREAGLVLAFCHPWDESPALRNKQFLPYRSPIPLVAVRRLEPTKSTMDFMRNASEPPYARANQLQFLLRQYAGVLEQGLVTEAYRGIDQLQAEGLMTEIYQRIDHLQAEVFMQACP